MKFKLWLTTLALLFSIAVPPAASHAEGDASFWLTADASSTETGKEWRVALMGQHLESLYAYEAVFEYDPALLKLAQAVSSLGGTGNGFAIEPIVEEGKITFAYTQTGHAPGISGDLELGSLAFQTLAPGQAGVRLSEVLTVSSERKEARWTGSQAASTLIVTASNSDSGSDTDSNTGGTGASTGGLPAANLPSTVENGKSGVRIPIAEMKSVRRADGQAVAVAAVSADSLAEVLAKLKADPALGSRIQIELPAGEQTVKVELPAASLAAAASQDAGIAVVIQTGGASYELPVQALDIAKLAAQLGVKQQDVKITVHIGKPSATDLQGISKEAERSGASMIGEALDFHVTAEGGGSSLAVGDFGGIYVTRTILLPGQLDPSTATGVLYDPATGELSFVPTRFQAMDGGRTRALLKRQGNSTYAVIRHTKSFDDLAGHWAKDEIALLASKLIVDGRTEHNFVPQGDVTRAEFATLLVKGLGLQPQVSSLFRDVSVSDWYAPYVGAAAGAGLVEGLEPGAFKPDDRITREQMATMLIRALKIVGTTVTASPTDAAQTDRFADHAIISSWAREGVTQALKAGLMNGKSAEAFEPSAPANRAEAAVVLKRLLQYAELID
ncbi:S-layer homology domain-containing protein [Paenibacillus puerhi]|uniref:S-layer homology domain-containing protein n=1 Tax=Paenibacillus puerhi TaxID=2692622 RepID=UPI0013576027|nr:S-layer homology domain-containing protein [Paenibacillus puerhi]